MRITNVSLLVIVAINIGLISSIAFASAFNVVDYGAKANDNTDNTASFQKALDEAGKIGSIVEVPAGRYNFTGSIKIPTGVTLLGSWQGPPAREFGTVLSVKTGADDENGTPFITLDGNAIIKGVVITYPDQPSNSEKPVPYPWSIRGLAQDCQVQDVMFIRAYRGIDFGTYPCSRHFINNVYGSVLKQGVYIDGSVDVGRINNIHFSGWGCGPLMNKWRKENLEVMTIGRADWVWITNCFAFEAKTGLRLIKGKGGNDKLPGPSHYIQMDHCGFDDTENPIIIEECEILNVSQSVFKGHAIKILDTNTFPVRFSQCNFSPSQGTTTLVEAGGKGRVSFMDCNFEYWDTVGAGTPALDAGCVSLLVQGCEFGTHNKAPFFFNGKLKRQINLKDTVRSAVIMGNRFRYGTRITNSSKGKVIIKDNVQDDFDLDSF